MPSTQRKLLKDADQNADICLKVYCSNRLKVSFSHDEDKYTLYSMIEISWQFLFSFLSVNIIPPYLWMSLLFNFFDPVV